MPHDEGTSEHWLDSSPPWASLISTPFRPSSVSNSQLLNNKLDGSTDRTTNQTLLSSLLRICSANGVEVIDFSVEERLGHALGEGRTYKVERRTALASGKGISGGSQVAVKKVKSILPRAGSEKILIDDTAATRIKNVLLELEVLSHGPLKNHPNIVQLLGISWTEEEAGYAPLLVMELASHGTLVDFFKSTETTLCEREQLCLDIATGFEIVHACMIAHGDVKQENILVFPHPDRRFTAKLSDFQLALLGEDDPVYRGTPIYNAPEVNAMKQRPQSSKSQGLQTSSASLPLCDAFSFGLLAFEIFCGGLRYYDIDATLRFREALHSAECTEQNFLDLALDFLRIPNVLNIASLAICRDIFSNTLCVEPRDRLRGGWQVIKQILARGSPVQSNASEITPFRLQKGKPIDYSILDFAYTIKPLSKDVLGTQLWAELWNASENAAYSDQRGRASFDLFILHTLGKISYSTSSQEGLDLLAAAGLHCYSPALLVGRRVFEANGRPVPRQFSEFPQEETLHRHLSFLQGINSEQWYSHAIRLTWRDELVRTLPDLIPHLSTAEDTVSFEQKVRKTAQELTDDQIVRLANEDFFLHQAVYYNNIEAATSLLAWGCDVQKKTPTGHTPLHLACRCANIAMVHLLLAHGANASLADNYNVAPIHWLVLLPRNEIESIGPLLKKAGADVNVTMKKGAFLYFDPMGIHFGHTPLCWACMCRNSTALSTLLDLGADPVESKPHPDIWDRLRSVQYALGIVAPELVELLLRKILDRIPKNRRPDAFAYIGVGAVNDLQRWYAHGGEYEAAYAKMIDVLDQFKIPFVLQPSHLPKNGIGTPLNRAAMSFNVPLAKLCLQKGQRVDSGRIINDGGRLRSTGRTPIENTINAIPANIAPLHKILEMLELLLNNGAKTSRQGPGMSSPIFYASGVHVPLPVLELLARRDPTEINIKNGSSTAFSKLASTVITDEDFACLRLLRDLGGDPDIETNHSEGSPDLPDLPCCCLTSTAGAIITEKLEVIQYLLDSNATAYIGQSGSHRQTFLHHFVRHAAHTKARFNNTAHDQRLASLLESILDHPLIRQNDLLNQADFRGLGPLTYAIKYELAFCVEVMLAHGATEGLHTEIEDAVLAIPSFLDTAITSNEPATTPRSLIKADLSPSKNSKILGPTYKLRHFIKTKSQAARVGLSAIGIGVDRERFNEVTLGKALALARRKA
ncbi:MAG: hypothetical protein M1820_008789 [Bogoriella megaspora]|nr:MAG: hypothetical protein M1820_008789 [Bogoriella megaspora]